MKFFSLGWWGYSFGSTGITSYRRVSVLRLPFRYVDNNPLYKMIFIVIDHLLLPYRIYLLKLEFLYCVEIFPPMRLYQLLKLQPRSSANKKNKKQKEIGITTSFPPGPRLNFTPTHNNLPKTIPQSHQSPH